MIDISVVGVLEMWLTEADRALFPIAGTKGKQVQRAEYRIIATYHQTVISYEFIVPRTGEANSEVDWTDNPIRCSVILEPDSIFKYGQSKRITKTEDHEMDDDDADDTPLMLRRPRGTYNTVG